PPANPGRPRAPHPPRLPAAPPADGDPGALLLAAATQFQGGGYAAALAQLELLLRRNPAHFEALCLAARALASLVQPARAAARCREAMRVDPLAIAPYRLLASVSEERGDMEGAKESLKKVVYLSPDFAPAYVDLGALYEREGDLDRARRMRVAALGLLR